MQDKSSSKNPSMKAMETGTSIWATGKSKSRNVENEVLQPKEALTVQSCLIASNPTVDNSSSIDEVAFTVPKAKPPMLQKSFSTDILPLFSGRDLDLDKVIHRSRLSSLQRIVQLVPDRDKKRDELWGVFRSLDGAFLKYD